LNTQLLIFVSIASKYQPLSFDTPLQPLSLSLCEKDFAGRGEFVLAHIGEWFAEHGTS
jgi:hypothetical protein